MLLISFSKTARPILRQTKVHSKSLSSFSDSQKKPTQRPKRIILIRHGESIGNVDDCAYVTTPDWRVPLTERGIEQSFEAGKKLRDIIGEDGKVFFYYSPYMRTRQTLKELQHHIKDDQIISVREEPRISEQQFGNFQNVEDVWEFKKERHEFGRFYYRFQSGEAGLDVYSRVSSFISTLVRDCQQYQKAGYDLDEVNVVIITHGLSLRLFLMRWFQVRHMVLFLQIWSSQDSTNYGKFHLISMFMPLYS
jgi:broad specificity phosphatase PhoE